MRRRRISLSGLGALVALLAWATPALAQMQHPICGQGQGDSMPPIKGTVGWATLMGAADTNAHAFGAASMVEKKLFPSLRREGATQAIHFNLSSVLGAARLPICSGRTDEVEMGKADLSAASLAGGFKYGPFTLYFAGSGTSHSIGTPWNARTAFLFTGVPLIMASPIAPIKNKIVGDSFSAYIDSMYGVDWASPAGTVSVAYVASRGLYTHVSQKHIRAFFGGVFKDVSKDIPYLRGGLNDLDWLLGDAVKAVGSTTSYLRRLQLPAAPPAGLSASKTAEQASKVTPEMVNFLTAHLEQWSIARWVDVVSAAQIRPKPDLYELTIGVHSPMFIPEHLVGSKTNKGADTGGYAIRASAGVIKLPAMYYYGVPGGYRFKAALDLGMVMGASSSYITFGFNSADTLAVFPYAYNAGQFSISLSFVN